MKTIFRLALGGLFSLLFFTLCFSQVPAVDTTGLSGWDPFKEPVTVESLKQAYNALFGALVVIWGYVARVFKFKTSKVPFVFVVAAGGAVIAGVFVALGLAKAAPLIISFFLSLGIFDTFFKPGERLFKKSVG